MMKYLLPFYHQNPDYKFYKYDPWHETLIYADYTSVQSLMSYCNIHKSSYSNHSHDLRLLYALSVPSFCQSLCYKYHIYMRVIYALLGKFLEGVSMICASLIDLL